MPYIYRYPQVRDNIIPTDEILGFSDSAGANGSTTYVMVKEILVIKEFWPFSTLRFTMDLQSTFGALVYGQVWYNGSALGAEHSTNSAAGWTTFTEDIDLTALKYLDYFDLRVKATAAEICKFQNFRIKGKPTGFIRLT